VGTIPLALWLGGIWGAQGVLVGQALGGVVFGFAAVWLALLAIGDPSVPPARSPGPLPATNPAPEVEPVASPGERRA
jgi:hypothetical protein